MFTLKLATASAGVALASAFGGWASAATLAVLTGDRTITMVDSETRKAVGSQEVTGFDGRLLGIDVRPADKMLYGLGADGTVLTIDPQTGAASEAGKLDIAIPENAVATVDFNPVADAVRIMGSDGTNLRAKIDAGTVTKDGNHSYAEGDMHKGGTPNIVAGAYTSSYAGTEGTALYVIDATIGALVKQDPPNDGKLSAVGKLGVENVGTPAFDILSDGAEGNNAWLLSAGKLYSVNLETGAASALGAIDGGEAARDIAIMPAE
jgi:hypothetical protein